MANASFSLRWGRKNGYARRLWDGLRTDHTGYIPSIPHWYTQLIQFSDFTAAATSEELDINVKYPTNAFPSNARIKDMMFHNITDWAGTSITAVTVEIGDTGDPNEGLTAVSTFTGVGAGIITPAYGTKLDGSASDTPPWFEAAYVPTITLRATGANVTALTAGKLRVAILVEPIQALGG